MPDFHDAMQAVIEATRKGYEEGLETAACICDRWAESSRTAMRSAIEQWDWRRARDCDLLIGRARTLAEMIRAERGPRKP